MPVTSESLHIIRFLSPAVSFHQQGSSGFLRCCPALISLIHFSSELRPSFHGSIGGTRLPPFLQMRQWRTPLPFQASEATFPCEAHRMPEADRYNSENPLYHDIASRSPRPV